METVSMLFAVGVSSAGIAAAFYTIGEVIKQNRMVAEFDRTETIRNEIWLQLDEKFEDYLNAVKNLTQKAAPKSAFTIMAERFLVEMAYREAVHEDTIEKMRAKFKEVSGMKTYHDMYDGDDKSAERVYAFLSKYADFSAKELVASEEAINACLSDKKTNDEKRLFLRTLYCTLKEELSMLQTDRVAHLSKILLRK